MPDAHLGLGSNLGDRAANLARAVALLRAAGVRVYAVADPVETAAVGCEPGAGPFLNSAAHVGTALAPRALLDVLLGVERQLGRRREAACASRPIDLDLLLYGDAVLDEPGLTLPHPRLHARRFVLGPLAQIAPHALHPTLRKTVAELLVELE